jgi:hypothetical protein
VRAVALQGRYNERVDLELDGKHEERPVTPLSKDAPSVYTGPFPCILSSNAMCLVLMTHGCLSSLTPHTTGAGHARSQALCLSA